MDWKFLFLCLEKNDELISKICTKYIEIENTEIFFVLINKINFVDNQKVYLLAILNRYQIYRTIL